MIWMEVKICNQQTNTPPSVGLQEGSAGEKMGLRDAALPPSPLILLLLTTPILLQGTTAQNTVFSVQLSEFKNELTKRSEKHMIR